MVSIQIICSNNIYVGTKLIPYDNTGSIPNASLLIIWVKFPLSYTQITTPTGVLVWGSPHTGYI